MSKFVTKWFYASVGEYENVQSEGWFWNKKYKKVKEQTPRAANYEEFSKLLADTYNDLDKEGYDVVNVIPLALGASEPVHATMNNNGGKTYLGETGYSVTRGAIVVGRRREV